MTPTEPAPGSTGLHAHGPEAAGPAEYVIRGAAESDLDAIAQFEIEIAKVSFSDDAIVDPALHRRRVSGSLSKPGEIMLVAEAPPMAKEERLPGYEHDLGHGRVHGQGAEPGHGAEAGQMPVPGQGAEAGQMPVPGQDAAREALIGWAWLSPRTNSLTGARYGNFRSLAVADIPDRSHVGELLLAAVLRAAADAGLTQLTGKVHARNLGMRALYRKFGFEAAHLTMELRLPPGGEASS
jgi:GNAT superfamily N-acetyltransferase